MAIQVVDFQTGGTKLERCLPKNQHAQRKLLNFENWVNGEVSKIGHLSKKAFLFIREIRVSCVVWRNPRCYRFCGLFFARSSLKPI